MSRNYPYVHPDDHPSNQSISSEKENTFVEKSLPIELSLPYYSYSNTIFDLYSDKISIHGFVEKAKSALKFDKDHYLLTLKIGSIFYHCLYKHYEHGDPFIFVTSYLYSDMSKNDFFLITSVSDATYGEIKTELNGIPLDMVCLPGRNKLETIIHIRVYFCKMVGIKKIRFTDIAEKQTKSDGYTLISYRIFATDKDISDLSIYSKFFRMPYILDSKLKHTCIDFSEFLQCIRTTKFNELIIETSDSHSDKELKNLKDKIGEKSLLEYFKNFDKEDHEKIKDLNNIVTLISNSTNLGEKYKKLISCVTQFTVHVDDYYNPKLILPQFKSIKKSKSKKSKKKPKKKSKKKSKKSKSKKSKPKKSKKKSTKV